MGERKAWVAVVGALAAGLTACAGGSGQAPAAVPPVVGSAGGTVTGPEGSSVTVPAGALEGSVAIRIAKEATGAPAEGPGDSFVPVSSVFTVTPHGEGFGAPVQVTLPIDPTLVPPGAQLVVLKAEPRGGWVVLGDATRQGSTVSVSVRDFSVFLAGVRSAPTPTPFTITTAVHGTPPELTVTHQFSGTRPTCTEGDLLETIHVVETRYVTTDDFGLHHLHDSYGDAFSVEVPGLPAAGQPLHALSHPFLAPALGPFQIGWVKARYTCRGEQLAPLKISSTPWVMESAPSRLPDDPAYGQLGVLARREDISDVRAWAGVAEASQARIQTAAGWLGNLAQHSKWMISHDGGASWVMLTQGASISLDTHHDALEAERAGLYTFGTQLPALSVAEDGALLRLDLCVSNFDYFSWTAYLDCMWGAPHAVTVASASIPPTFLAAPVSTVVVAGDGASFSATAAGYPGPDLQWQRRAPGGTWSDLPGEQASTLNLPAASFADDGAQFQVVATNMAGSATSATATLNVVDQAAPPIVVGISGSLVVARGGTAVFAATVRGTAPLRFQWSVDGLPLAGATSPILRLDAVTTAQTGSYALEVSNPAGAGTSSALALSVVDPGTSIPVAPTIIDQPAAATATAGESATFMVGAGGDGLHYQWLRDGAEIRGATTATHTTPALTVGDDGIQFSVLVYNGAGLVLSQAARLTVHGVNPPGMALFVGDFALGFGGGAADGTGIDARLDSPDGLVADAAGNLYVAESNQPAVVKIDPAGVVTTLLHHPNAINSLALGPDGSLYVGAACGMPRLLPPLVAGAINQPVQDGACPGQVRGVTVDAAGAVLVSLPGLNSIRGVSVVGGVTSFPVFAGALNEFISPGTSDGIGTSARFHGQQGMARAADGTIYVADTENHTIRKVSPAGDVTTWVGAPGVPGLVDGRGAAARLYRPTQLAFDTSGNLYVLTQGDPSAPVAHVHRISPAGDVLTVFDATAEVLAIAPPAQAASARNIKGLAVLGADRVALTAGNAVVIRTL